MQTLAAHDVLTYVIGFGTTGGGDGIDRAQLNRLACAGHTAAGFPAPCTADATGAYTATDPAGPALYLEAQDADALAASLAAIAGEVCCDCVE